MAKCAEAAGPSFFHACNGELEFDRGAIRNQSSGLLGRRLGAIVKVALVLAVHNHVERRHTRRSERRVFVHLVARRDKAREMIPKIRIRNQKLLEMHSE